jgi:hypothetical protein
LKGQFPAIPGHIPKIPQGQQLHLQFRSHLIWKEKVEPIVVDAKKLIWAGFFVVGSSAVHRSSSYLRLFSMMNFDEYS